MVEFIDLTITLNAQAYSKNDSSAERFQINSEGIKATLDVLRCRDREALVSRINEKITQVILSEMEKQHKKALRDAKRSNHEADAWKL